MYKFPVKKIKLLKAIMIVMVIFALTVSLFAGFFIAYIRTTVNGCSMAPTLNSAFITTGKRDVVYINRFGKVSRGDIVVLDLRKDSNFNTYAIKRLIAKEGDVVNIKFDSVNMQYYLIVNDKIVDSKPYKDFGYNTYDCFRQYIINHQNDNTRICKDDELIKGVIIKSGEIFVLGDNWDMSKDSSLVGPVDAKDIIGKVDIIVNSNENELLSVLKSIF